TDTGGGFRDLFSQFFGGRDQAEESPTAERGADLEYALSIDFWQAIRGTQARLNISHQEVCETCHGSKTAPGGGSVSCPQCEGTGNVTQMAGSMKFNLTCPRCSGQGKLQSVCPTCHGDGRVLRNESVEVRIPPGAQNGSRLRVAGKGNAGTMGMLPGDLYITSRVEPHPVFARDGDNIQIKVPVTVTEAGLGAKIEGPTIDGRALLKIPPGTQNGQKFRQRRQHAALYGRGSGTTRSGAAPDARPGREPGWRGDHPQHAGEDVGDAAPDGAVRHDAESRDGDSLAAYQERREELSHPRGT